MAAAQVEISVPIALNILAREAGVGWRIVNCLDRAFDGAETILGSVLLKAKFWKLHAGDYFNDRQRIVLNRLLDGFEGRLTSSKWPTLTKSSQDTASRDINDLLKRGILVKDTAGGRSTSYSLAMID